MGTAIASGFTDGVTVSVNAWVCLLCFLSPFYFTPVLPLSEQSPFQRRYPQVRLLFRPCPVAELRRQVSEGAVDVAFVLEEPLQAKSLIVESLVREPVLLVAACDHPLTQRREVGPTDLDGERLLLTEVGCRYRNLFLRRLAADGIYPTTVLEFTSVEAIKQCVMAQMGITVLPKVAVERELASGQLAALPWREAGFHVMTQMLWHREKWLSPALRVFLTMARELFSPLEAGNRTEGIHTHCSRSE